MPATRLNDLRILVADSSPLFCRGSWHPKRHAGCINQDISDWVRKPRCIGAPLTSSHVTSQEKLRVLLVSIVPPKNDCGVRIVMHRHLVERTPFELHVASNADFADDLLIHTRLRLPYGILRLRRSRFGPQTASWVTGYESLVWPLTPKRELDAAIETFCPQVILTLAEYGLCHIACDAAKRYSLPLAGLFLDWFPTVHVSHGWAQRIVSRRYRELYAACDLAFCTSDGMKEVLGPHRNSHVIYPMPGSHRVAQQAWPPPSGKFRIVYVGAVQGAYGRMLRSLIGKIEATNDLEVIVIGPNDWPPDFLKYVEAKGLYLGFKPPEEAAKVLASADALLAVMSFEREHELFVRTSFTTKFLDYVAFGKPVILWGPDYCTPARVVRESGGAVVVSKNNPDLILSVCRQIADDGAWREQLSQQSRQLHQTLFNPDRLQNIFVSEIEKLVRSRGPRN